MLSPTPKYRDVWWGFDLTSYRASDRSPVLSSPELFSKYIVASSYISAFPPDNIAMLYTDCTYVYVHIMMQCEH